LPVPKLRIFISYAWVPDSVENDAQQRWAKDLANDLKTAGFVVFLDLFDMHDDMSVKMREGIVDSDAAVILCTPTLKNRVTAQSNVAFELSEILSRKHSNQGNFQVLPLVYSSDFKASVPDVLKGYFARDCRDQGKYAQQLTGLHSPLGIVPGLLNISGGDVAFEALLNCYQLKCLSNLPVRSPRFCGREVSLMTLAERWSTSLAHTQVISGLGGMGKTQLALEYAYRHQKDYQICRWLLSEGEQLRLSVRLFAEELGVDLQGLDDTSVTRKMFEALSRHASWLLVFDNVEDAASIRAYLPNASSLSAHQHILVTSRSHGWPQMEMLPLDVFDMEDTLNYMRTQLPDEKADSVQQLGHILGYLPLALSQAVAYLRASGLSVETYLTLLRSQPSAALNERGTEASYYHTIQSTVAISRDKVSVHPQALRMLNACAWLVADSIPLYLFEHTELLGCKEAVYEALKVLNLYSLVHEFKPGYLKIHRLVQTVLRTESTDAGLPVLVSANNVLQAVYPWDKTTAREFERARDLMEHLVVVMDHNGRRLLTHPEEWLPHYSRMIDCLTDAYFSFGQAAKVRELLERALPIAEKYYGSDHVEVAKTLSNLGNAYGALGDAHKKQALLERALAIEERHYGSDHVEVAKSLSNLGNAYGALGNAHKQKALLERSLAIEERHYGSDHVEVAKTLSNLGNAYGALGDAHKKQALLERALAIEERHYGSDHVEVAKSLSNLGNAYGALGDVHKHKALLERALAIKERHYGLDHAEVAKTLTNLGNAYGALGDVHKHKALLERALAIKERHYGSDHVEVAITLSNLGNVHGALGDAHKQKALLVRAFAVLESHYGSDHVVVATTLSNLGNAYGSLGDAHKKQALLERALAVLERHYGADHVEVAKTLTNLGNVHGALGDAHKQKALLVRALAVLERHYGADHVVVAITLSNLGNAYGSLGDAHKKKALLERALAVLERHYGSDHVEVAKTLTNLGNVHGALGDAHKQKALLVRALAVLERHYGADHVEVAKTLTNLGNVHGALGDAHKQKALLVRALAVLERHYGADHVEVAITLSNLGNAYGSLGDAHKKKALLERALAIEERHYGADHSEVAFTSFNLSIAHESVGAFGDALSCMQVAYRIFGDRLGNQHDYTLRAERALVRLTELADGASPDSKR
jgi:tetratricopeptide (TPR) repeat protein